MTNQPAAPGETASRAPDGIVEVEHIQDRYRIAVRHSETDADFLWLSQREADDVISGLLREAAR